MSNNVCVFSNTLVLNDVSNLVRQGIICLATVKVTDNDLQNELLM